MPEQLSFSLGLSAQTLKEGTTVCPSCQRSLKAYKKTLDKRLASYLIKVLRYVRKAGRNEFRVSDVFAGDHVAIADFQKLHYWGFCVQKAHSKYGWCLTKHGYRFLMGERAVSKCLWVFNNHVIDRDPVKVTVDGLSDRWQTERSDYLLNARLFDPMPEGGEGGDNVLPAIPASESYPA